MATENTNKTERDKFSKRLKAFRKQAGFKQKELADIAEIHPVLLGRYETGKALPRKKNLKKLASALNVTVSDLDVLGEYTEAAARNEIAAYLAKFDIKVVFYDSEEGQKIGLKDTEKDVAGITAPKEELPFSDMVLSEDLDTIQEAIIMAETETEQFFKDTRHEYLKNRLLYHLLIKRAINNLPFYEEKLPDVAAELKAYLKITKD